MGYYKNLDIERQENEFFSQPLTYDEGDEAWFYNTISNFQGLTEKYNVDTVVNNLPADLKFKLLESIIKSQGNQRT